MMPHNSCKCGEISIIISQSYSWMNCRKKTVLQLQSHLKYVTNNNYSRLYYSHWQTSTVDVYNITQENQLQHAGLRITKHNIQGLARSHYRLLLHYIAFINLYSASTTSLMRWSSANSAGSSIYKIKYIYQHQVYKQCRNLIQSETTNKRIGPNYNKGSTQCMVNIYKFHH